MTPEEQARLNFINGRIDELKTKISQKSPKKPMSGAGWASYVALGDNSILNQEFAKEQAALNRKFQEEQNELNRQNVLALRQQQKAEQDEYNKDEWMKQRSLAGNKLTYAKAALLADKSNDPLVRAGLQRDVDNAQEEFDYWNKRVGLDTKPEVAPAPAPVVSGPTAKEESDIISSLIDVPEWTDEAKKKAEEENEKETDLGKKAKNATAIAKRGKTKEEVAAERKTKLANANKEFKALKSRLDRDSYLDEHPEFTAVNGELKYKK